jgi:hypothetical protein
MFNNSCIVSLNTKSHLWGLSKNAKNGNKGYCGLGDLIVTNKQSKQTTSLRDLNVQKHNI